MCPGLSVTAPLRLGAAALELHGVVCEPAGFMSSRESGVKDESSGGDDVAAGIVGVSDVVGAPTTNVERLKHSQSKPS